MTLAGLEPTIAAGERPQTRALDQAATGTGDIRTSCDNCYKELYVILGLWFRASSR
jgi:hypothetical protein